MVTLPENLTATKFPGYFWDVKEHVLYSIKIGGVLKELTKIPFGRLTRFVPNAWRMDCDKFCYNISVKGRQNFYTDRYLYSLKIEDSEIPVFNKEKE